MPCEGVARLSKTGCGLPVHLSYQSTCRRPPCFFVFCLCQFFFFYFLRLFVFFVHQLHLFSSPPIISAHLPPTSLFFLFFFCFSFYAFVGFLHSSVAFVQQSTCRRPPCFCVFCVCFFFLVMHLLVLFIYQLHLFSSPPFISVPVAAANLQYSCVVLVVLLPFLYACLFFCI